MSRLDLTPARSPEKPPRIEPNPPARLSLFFSLSVPHTLPIHRYIKLVTHEHRLETSNLLIVVFRTLSVPCVFNPHPEILSAAYRPRAFFFPFVIQIRAADNHLINPRLQDLSGLIWNGVMKQPGFHCAVFSRNVNIWSKFHHSDNTTLAVSVWILRISLWWVLLHCFQCKYKGQNSNFSSASLAFSKRTNWTCLPCTPLKWFQLKDEWWVVLKPPRQPPKSLSLSPSLSFCSPQPQSGCCLWPCIWCCVKPQGYLQNYQQGDSKTESLCVGSSREQGESDTDL